MVKGECNCGAVQFEADLDLTQSSYRCNCSICRMTGFLHLIVPASRFRLLQGEDALVEYRFNTGTARHRFCGHCGIKSFYVPRSHPDGFSVNARCLDDARTLTLHVTAFDDGVDDRVNDFGTVYQRRHRIDKEHPGQAVAVEHVHLEMNAEIAVAATPQDRAFEIGARIGAALV